MAGKRQGSPKIVGSPSGISQLGAIVLINQSAISHGGLYGAELRLGNRVPPAAGDELQGIKRGVVELADLVLVNKADGELAAAARRSAADYASAMRLLRAPLPEWQVPVRAVSALEGTGIKEVWDDVARFRAALEQSGAWSRRRAEQGRAALWSEIGDSLLEHFRAAPTVARHLAAVEREVMAGTRTPTAAARSLLAAFLAEGGQKVPGSSQSGRKNNVNRDHAPQ